MPNKYIAAVDIGTNSFHLIIAEVKPGGDFKIVDRKREVIRLCSREGEDLSYISEGEGEAAVSILRQFRETADRYGAVLKAAATSAVREADNREWFIAKAAKEAAVKIDLLSGTEEARLIYKGAEKALKLEGERVLCTDIGGGSTEIIMSNKGELLFAESIKIGAVRLTKKFFKDYKLDDERITECNNYIKTLIMDTAGGEQLTGWLAEQKFIMAGCSGTIQTAGRMISFMRSGKEPESINGFRFTAAELRDLSEMVFRARSSGERERLPGMEQKRADIFPAGLLILNNIFKIFQPDAMVISEYALREGIVYEGIGCV